MGGGEIGERGRGEERVRRKNREREGMDNRGDEREREKEDKLK